MLPTTMLAAVLFVLFSVVLKSTEAGIWSNCEIEEFGDYEWLMGSYQTETPIDDTYNGIVGTFSTTYVEAIKIEEGKYLNATLENNILTIFTTEAFKDFEEDMKGGSYYDQRLSIEMKLVCRGSESRMTIYQKVNDINNHDPVLSQREYQYNLAMPVPKGFVLTGLLPISAYDGDFTNTNIYFTIEDNEDFKIDKTGKVVKGEKDLFTSLTSLRSVAAPFRREFTLVATDEGNPTKNTTAKVIISLTKCNDENGSSEETAVHPPVFAEHLYFANYTSSNELQMDGAITIKYGVQDDTIIRQSGYNDYFKVQIKDITKGELEVEVLKQLPDSMRGPGFIVVEIEAENPGLAIPGRTALLISFPNDSENGNESSVHPPVFSQHLYIANYTSSHQLEMEEPIIITYGAQADTGIGQSGYNDYFRVQIKDSSEGELEVQVIKQLPDSTLNTDFIVIEIKAENPELTIPGRTSLLIRLPGDSENGNESGVHPPVFGEHLYFANYTSSHDLEMEEPITITYGAQTDTVIRQSSYNDYLKIEIKDTSKGELQVSVIKQLPDSSLNAEFIIIEIEAENPGLTIPGRTSLMIFLPDSSENGNESGVHPPVFREHLYFANYTSSHDLKMEESIIIKYGAQADTVIRQSGYDEFFKVELIDASKGQLQVRKIKQLPDSFLNKDFIIIEVEAENPGLTIPGRTSLLIRLPSDSENGSSTTLHPPVFGKHTYLATYTSSDELKMDEQINIKYGAQDDTVIQQSDYSEYFKVQMKDSSSGELQVRTLKQLPDSALELDMILIEIEAVNPGLTIPGRTTLLIRLPSNDCSLLLGYSYNSVVPIIASIAGLALIIFINVIVLKLYFSYIK